VSTVSVRYFVTDVDEAIAFYCGNLGFHEVMHPAPAFAMLSRGDLRLVLSAPGGGPGGGQAMPDGTLPTPGGWNRFAIEVTDLDSLVARLRAQGASFRNDIVNGVGGRQILLDDPSGNPVELFEPSIAEARLSGPAAQREQPPAEAHWTTWVRFAIAADTEDAARAVMGRVLPRLKIPLGGEPRLQPFGIRDGVWVATADPDPTAMPSVEPDNAQGRCSYIGGLFGDGVPWTARVTDSQGKWEWPPDIWSRRPGEDDVLIDPAVLAVTIWVGAEQAPA
jgi:catechol 2,3-dioxygenase-like lactoylglutathione lyase family enzyme